MSDVYLHGHHESVLASHGARTADGLGRLPAPPPARPASRARRRLRARHDHRSTSPRRSARGRVARPRDVDGPLEQARRHAAARGDGDAVRARRRLRAAVRRRLLRRRPRPPGAPAPHRPGRRAARDGAGVPARRPGRRARRRLRLDGVAPGVAGHDRWLEVYRRSRASTTPSPTPAATSSPGRTPPG